MNATTPQQGLDAIPVAVFSEYRELFEGGSLTGRPAAHTI